MHRLPILHLALVLSSILKANAETGNGALRLIRDNQYSDTQAWRSGIVQIYYGGSWGNICKDSYFSSNDAHVICHQLGYTGASSFSKTGSITQYGTDGNTTLIEDVSCSISYLTLLQCSVADRYSTECSNDHSDLVINCYTTRIWDSPYPGQIRLTGGEYSNQGLLEIYCNGQWGTVCDHSFGDMEAQVTCSQLGYNYFYTYDTLPQRGDASQSIWLNDIGCNSSAYNCLSSCSSGSCTSSAITSCSHSEDITLDCSGGSSNFVTEGTCEPITDTVETGNGALRLIRDNQYSDTQAWSSGIVQIYYGGSWGNICDDYYFSFDEAEVICHQLGYIGASSFGTTSSITQYGTDGNTTLIEDVSCSISHYLTLLQCRVHTQYSTECSNDNLDVVIKCYTTRIWDSPYPGQIRLAGGKYSNQGLLEIYCNGEWGTVCDHSFGATDARVTCRQLGYNYYYTYDTLPQRGNAFQSIWLSNIDCSSYHKCLSACYNGSCTSSAISNCHHNEDITLDCSGGIDRYVTEETCEPITDTDETGNGALRLIRDNQYSDTQAWSSGIVQIYYGGSWGNICDDSYFSFDEADVICHQLGYIGASSFGTTSSITQYGTDGIATLIEDVSCTISTYLTLLQCSVHDQYSTECSNDNLDLVINCYTTRIWDSPYPGQIRLTGGKYSNQGLLEIYCNGQWGTVCANYYIFRDAAAQVTCRQLGYNYFYTYDTFSQRGNESQSIWLNDISCTSSTYNCLSSCNSGSCTSSPITSCSHYKDITLDCSYSSSYNPLSVTEETCEPITDTVGPNSVGAICLLNSGSTSPYNTAGRVQVWYGGQWGNICNRDSYHSSFGYGEADVVCHQLGWSGSSSYSTGQYDSDQYDRLPAVIEDLSCSYHTYLTIFQCSYSTSVSSSCTNLNDVSVSCYTTRIWNRPYVGQIRLSRGVYSNQGLLEVYCNDEWGTVCDDTFDSTDASVVCRQLGYNSYYSYANDMSITGNASQPIWLDNVQCFGSSIFCLAYCETCPSSEYANCVHSQDITVECSYSSPFTANFVTEETCKSIANTSGPNSVGAIRLLNNGNTSLYNTAGRVQVWYGGHWGNICATKEHLAYNEANVICHQLGWSGASSSYSTGQYDSYGNDGLPAVIDDLSCSTSYYLTIFQCSYSTSVSSSCTSEHHVSVKCYTTRIWNNPYVGQIRLSRGMYSNQGLLEVYCNDEWGTVCDDTFDSTDASVVCRQLGYNSYYSYDHLSITGNDSQPIWLDNVQCVNSSTSCLAYCETCPSSEYANCVHSKDVTVECSISISSSSVSTRESTCTNADSGPTDIGPTDSSDDSINVGGLVGGIIAGTFFIIILVVSILLCICRVRIVSSFRRRRQQQSYQHLTQPYPGQQQYPMTPSSTQPQQPPPSDDDHPYSPGDSEYPPPYSSLDTSNIHQQLPPPYPGTQSTQVGLPEPQPF